MEGLLDLLKKIQFNPTPASLGLLNMGAQMLNSSTNQRQPVGFGNVLGGGLQGMTEGMMAGQQFRNSSADNQYRQQLLNSKLAEMEKQKKREEALSQLDLTQAPDQIAKQLASLGMTKEALDLVKPKREGIPTGWNATETGELEPMPITGGGNYMDYQLQLANQKAQIPSYGEPQRLQMAQEDQGMQRTQLGIALQNAELAQKRFLMDQAKANEPKQASEFQQWTMQQKEEKKQAELGDAISNIDDTIGDFQRLKGLQEETTTGPIAGSPPIAALRKMGPNFLTGGDNLQRLEKGYNELAVKAIGAFKAGGVSFGQLSNKEGEWIRSTQQTIDTGGEINQEMLDKGIKLLESRKKRLSDRIATPRNFDIQVPDSIKGDQQKELDYVNEQLVQPEPSQQTPQRRATDKPTKVTSEQDYNSLPSGAQYIHPDGSIRRKK